MKPAYSPHIEAIRGVADGFQQVFTADQVVATEEDGIVMIGFAENLSGATVHTLLVSFLSEPSSSSTGDLCVEFNDQGNARSGDDIASLELEPDRFVVTFGPKANVFAGRVSYSPEADILEGPTWSNTVITRVVAHFSLTSPEFPEVSRLVQRVAQLGCQLKLGPGSSGGSA